MSWVTTIWSMVASACLTLAAMHLLVWCKQRAAWANLLFALAAAGTAALGFCELWMMRAETPEKLAFHPARWQGGAIDGANNSSLRRSLRWYSPTTGPKR